jgi:hypothetical protein
MRTQARLAALLGDIALFDVGLFKPTCVASFGFARQLLLQLGVVVVGALVVFLPIYARILAQLKKDPSYRSFARVKASITDFYKGDFGQEVFTRLGKIFHLVDVQWPLLAYKALCAFRCDADGYLASSPSERCRVQNYVLGIVCLLVFVVPVPLIQEFTIRREYELRGGVHAPHVQALFGWSFRDLRPGRHAWRNVKKVFYLLLVAVAALVEAAAVQLCLAILILAAASYCQNTFRPYLGWRLNALESLGCYASVAACALGVLGIEDNARYATVRAVDGLVILGVLLAASCSLAYAELVDRQSRKATPRFLAERCRERHTTDIEQRRDKHEPPGPLLPKKNNSCDDLATAIESAAQKVDRFERRLENKARHAARDVLTDGDYQDLPADVLRDIGALQAASDALNARAFYLACHDPERTNDDLERYVQVARRIEYLISDASFTSSFSASPGARFWQKWSREKGIIDFVAMLEDRERTVVFGFLVRLQRFLADEKKSTALHSLVSARDRPSILYYLLVAPAVEHADCVQLLRDVVQTCRTVELSAVDRALVVPREVHGTNTPQEALEKGLKVWHARRTKSVEALLGEGGLETAQRFVNIEDDCLRASSAVIGGTASPVRSTTTPSKRVRFQERRRHGA